MRRTITANVLVVAAGLPGCAALPDVSLFDAPVTAPSTTEVVAPPGDVTPEFSVWQPGTLINVTKEYPQAGVPFSATECTVALTFDGADGRNYGVTASHCGSTGDLVWSPDSSTILDYQREIGTIIYSAYEDESWGSRENPAPDIAIVEISNAERTMPIGGEPVTQTVLTYNNPPGLPACKEGGTTGVTCGNLSGGDQEYVMKNAGRGEVYSTGNIADICAQRGDSGGPIYREDAANARIVGLISGTRSTDNNNAETFDCSTHPTDAAIAYVPTAAIVDTIWKIVPDARLRDVG